MKIKKGVMIISALVLLLFMLSGCRDDKTDLSATTPVKTKVNAAVIKGPSGIGMVNLMELNASGTADNDYNFTVVSSPDEIVSKISNKEVDLATPPTNLAATLYKKTSGKVKMLAASTKGVLYILEDGDTIKSAADLKGKTIYTTGQGANPEYILKYILTKNGIDPEKDVNIIYKTDNDELATLLATGAASVALVPEPIVTSVKAKKAELRVALDMTAEWEKASGGKSQLLMGCVIGRTEFIENNPEAVAKFLAEYETSISKAKTEIDSTAALCEKYGIIPKAAVAKAALPRCGLTYIDGNDMINHIKGYFDVLFAANPDSVGGTLPNDEFYYNPQK
ncbi:MAG: ABC transporter substrate-binding protein [Oscillospiraceae bacterium]|nr:ABC transporter substrate-binding protein [Oscillospiraceae bacterium]MDD4413032.1 ABC transporter substrate-binding protein [Oscillospiraceae bacterium]